MIGTSVSHYRIVSHIGAGGMGTVYLAEDTNLKRRVALKFLSPGTVDDPDAAARLLREARAASALDHPNIATVYEIGNHAGQPFIAMAHYEGETLATRLAHGPIPVGEAARILVQLADALDAAHSAGIVHRDLKPSNLMLTTTKQLKVLDFGLAKIDTGETAMQLTAAGSTVGTAAYMSPEQAAGDEAVDARSDLWSLGVVTYEMLAGRKPFNGANALGIIHAVLTETPTPVKALRQDAAQELEEVVDRTLVRDRERRTITASAVRDLAAACDARLSAGQRVTSVRPRTSRGTRIVAAALTLALAVAGTTWWVQRNAKVRWARQVALPEIARLAEAEKFDAAYKLAAQAQQYLGDDAVLSERMAAVSGRADISSDPAGAAVFYRPYNSAEPWRPLGKTPVRGAQVPHGLLHWKVELPGYAGAEDIAGCNHWHPSVKVHFPLFRPPQTPPHMVRILSSGQPVQLYLAGLDHLPEVHLPDYWIDRHEVTNREYKRFVDDGGYRRPELWREPFLDGGTVLPFDAAMARFRDATGRPGPASWEMGAYVAGQDDYPVSGVSWYEASAYARWAGKSLPTIYHWSRAADPVLSGDVVPASNFSGKALHPAGASLGINRGGTVDMAGNVKEWCLNAAGAQRYILGGAWNEPPYMFTDLYARSPFAREPTHGFRCVKPDRSEDLSPSLSAAINVPERDPRTARPVDEPVFQGWLRSLYSFDHDRLDVKVESIDESSPEWRTEKVSYAAAYGERIPAYLFIPKHVAPPYQVLVIFPGSNVFTQRSSVSIAVVLDYFNFIMRSGRALLYPVYKSTHERGDNIKTDYPNMTANYRDHMVMWAKDVGRSVDYLHTRRDIIKGKIGFLGYSWGAALTPVMVAVEPRLSLAVSYLGGLYLQPSLPEADTVNFAPRVKVPVLMLNGRFDFYNPTATSQEPMFKLLGTPAEHKRYVVYETSHAIPRNAGIKEVVDWMDKYWGQTSR